MPDADHTKRGNGDLFAMLDHTQTVVGIVGVALTFSLSLFGWQQYGLPAWRRRRELRSAMWSTFVGKKPVLDEAGKVISPAQPGIRAQMDTLTDAVTKLADTHVRLGHLEDTVAEHGREIGELKAARAERMVAQAEAAHMWRALANDREPDEFTD